MGYATLLRRSEVSSTQPQPRRSAGKPHPKTLGAQAEIPPLQAKLRVGASNDRLEREADAVADLVLGMPALDFEPPKTEIGRQSQPNSPVVQRMCAACSEDEQVVQRACSSCEEEARVQRQAASVEAAADPELQQTEKNVAAAGGKVNAAAPDARTAIPAVLSRDGSPLAPSLRAYFEPRFGRDLGRVRVHSGGDAAAAAASVGAHAFTVGHHIVFNTGQYSPASSTGRRLIAHELTHVLQQRGGLQSVHGQMLQRASQRTNGKGVGAENGSDSDAAISSDSVLQRQCIDGEGPPTPESPILGEPGPHPLIYRGTGVKRSRRPAVGDAQTLLNRFLSQFESGSFACGAGSDLVAITQIRKTLQQDPLEVDCRFGPNTEKATLMFQHCVFPNQPGEWDGKIGPHTWARLDALRAGPSPSPAPTPAPTPQKPGTQTACQRTCESDFDRCIKQSSNPLACLGQRSGCFAGCPKDEPPSFAVCARRLQPPVEVSGCNHTYVETPTRRYAIITPCTSKASFALPGGGVAMKTDVSPDPCDRATTCVPCQAKPGITDLEACFASQFASYAGPSKHHVLGPNSNTFAGTLARACCANMVPQPAVFGCVPGWDDPPAPAASSTSCPSGAPKC